MCQGEVPRDRGPVQQSHLVHRVLPAATAEPLSLIRSWAYRLLKTLNIFLSCKMACGSLFLTDSLAAAKCEVFSS